MQIEISEIEKGYLDILLDKEAYDLKSSEKPVVRQKLQRIVTSIKARLNE